MTPLPASPAELAAILPRVELIADDGVPMESDLHRLNTNLLINSIAFHLRERDDFYVVGNMFIYFSGQQARNRDFPGPDFFFVNNVPRQPPRHWWAVWEEGGCYPDVIIELTSPSTARADRDDKFRIYEGTFRTPDYFISEPASQQLNGWHLGQRYKRLKLDTNGRLWCAGLGLFLGVWHGERLGVTGPWLRFFQPDGALVLVHEEYEQRQATLERNRARRLAELSCKARKNEASAEELAELERLENELTS